MSLTITELPVPWRRHHHSCRRCRSSVLGEHPAAASKQQRARFPPCWDLSVRASGNSGLSRLTVVRASRQLVSMWIQNLLFQLCPVHSEKWREIEIKTSCIHWNTGKISRKFLNGKLTRPSEERENGSAETVRSWGRSCGEKLGKERNSDISLQEINQEFESQRFQERQASRWADQADRDKNSLYGELEMRNRLFQWKSCKILPRNWRIEKNLSRRITSSKTSKIWRIVCASREESYACDSFVGSDSGIIDKKICQTPENFTILSQEAALERPTFPIRPPLFCPRTLPRCDSGLPRGTHNGTGVTGNVFFFFERPLGQEGLSSTIFNNLKNLASSSQGLRPDTTDTARKHSKMKRESSNTVPSHHFQSGSGFVDSDRRNLFSQWYYGLSENSDFGNAFLESDGFSKLQSQLQRCGLSKNSRSSDHYALDQRSWDCRIDWRTYDIAIGYGAKRLPRLRYAWCNDCVCIEKASWHANTSPKERVSVEEQRAQKHDRFWRERQNCVPDLREFPCNRSLWSRTRTFVRRTTMIKTSASDGILLCYL